MKMQPRLVVFLLLCATANGATSSTSDPSTTAPTGGQPAAANTPTAAPTDRQPAGSFSNVTVLETYGTKLRNLCHYKIQADNCTTEDTEFTNEVIAGLKCQKLRKFAECSETKCDTPSYQLLKDTINEIKAGCNNAYSIQVSGLILLLAVLMKLL